MSINSPAITIYYRVIDNITDEEIEGYQLLKKNSSLTFGKVNGLYGGESPFVVEFDIWNNEPAFHSNMYLEDVSDAINCNFTAWDNDELKTYESIQDEATRQPYIRARCTTKEYGEFKAIGGVRSLTKDQLYGSLIDTSGILLGNSGGDHMKIQTKISVPHYTDPSFKSFVFEFRYDYI